MNNEITREELRKHFASRMEAVVKLRELQSNDAPDEEIDQCREEIDGSVLCFDVRIMITVLLGYGGPSDGIDLYFDKEGNYLWGHYWYQWAGPRAQWDITDDEADMILSAHGLDDPYNVLCHAGIKN